MRKWLPLVLCVSAAACGLSEHPVEPITYRVEGRYLLAVYNGQLTPVPGTMDADTVVLNTDSTFTERTYRFHPATSSADTASASGTYSVNTSVGTSTPGVTGTVTFNVVSETRSGGSTSPAAELVTTRTWHWYGNLAALVVNDGAATESRYLRIIGGGGGGAAQ